MNANNGVPCEVAKLQKMNPCLSESKWQAGTSLALLVEFNNNVWTIAVRLTSPTTFPSSFFSFFSRRAVEGERVDDETQV